MQPDRDFRRASNALRGFLRRLPPLALGASPDTIHTPRVRANAIVAAATVVHLLILSTAERILQRTLITAPKSPPNAFEATSTADGSRFTASNWVVSTNAESEAAAMNARNKPSSPSTIPTGTNPAILARTWGVRMSKPSVMLPGGRK
jgi:hypothetical protein